MADRIKPTDLSKSQSLSDISDVKPEEASEFKKVLNEAKLPESAPVTHETIASIAHDLRAQHITPHEASERLINKTLDKVGALLSPEQRVELESQLRESLASNPAMQALMRDLEQGT